MTVDMTCFTELNIVIDGGGHRRDCSHGSKMQGSVRFNQIGCSFIDPPGSPSPLYR